MKTVKIYLQQVKLRAKDILFTDGQDEIAIPHDQIIERNRIVKKEYAVVVPERWAKEEGIA